MNLNDPDEKGYYNEILGPPETDEPNVEEPDEDNSDE